jgi:hypothetical protein
VKSFKEVILGLCIGGGFILILAGIEAANLGNKWYPAYFISGATIAAGFLKLSTRIIK